MKLGAGKQIYLASETRKHSEKNNVAALGGDTQHVDAVVTADGMFQLRGGQELSRIHIAEPTRHLSTA